MPFSVRRRFAAGPHLVSIQTEPDALARGRPPGFRSRSAAAVASAAGGRRPESRRDAAGLDFLRDALSPARDPHPAVLVRVASIAGLDAGILSRDLAGPGNPAMLVLCNAGKLTPQQQAAVAGFVEKGGGLLVAGQPLGLPRRRWRNGCRRTSSGRWATATTRPRRPSRSPPHFSTPRWNYSASPNPADSATPASRDTGSSPCRPAVRPSPSPGSPATTRCRRKTVRRRQGAGNLRPAGQLLADKPGRTAGLRSAGPRTRRITSPAPLGGAEPDARPAAAVSGCPKGMPTAGWVLQPPVGASIGRCRGRIRSLSRTPTDPGVYTLKHTASGAERYYVVQSDPGESDLSPWTETDRDRVKRALPAVEFNDDRAAIVSGITPTRSRRNYGGCA